METNNVLQQRYRIQHPLGKGGMGAVYSALDLNLDRTVAVKEMQGASTPSLVKAFEREAKLLSRLRHPALPVVIDYFPVEGNFFLVMDFVPGEDLFGILRRDGKAFPADQVLSIADQLLNVLDYLHANGVIHRDIKPANLKLLPDERLMLLDFGLAKGSVQGMTVQSRSLQGYTAQYAPLEQLQGRGTDLRSDLYSAGATLYHLATGKTPISALRRANALLAGSDDPLLPCTAADSVLSHEFREALRSALSMDPNQRPQTARQLHDLMFSKGKPTSGARSATRPPVDLTQIPKTRVDPFIPQIQDVGPARRKGTWMIFAGLFVVLVVAVILAFRVRGASIQPAAKGSSQSQESTSQIGDLSNALRPVETLDADASVARMMIDGEGKSVYYLNRLGDKLCRVSVEDRKLDDCVDLAPNTRSFCLSRDGYRIFSCAWPGNQNESSAAQYGTIQVIDTEQMKIQNTMAVSFDPFDIELGGDGLLYLTGGSEKSAQLAIVDATRASIVSKSLLIGYNSFLRITPDSRRLYVASQLAGAGTIRAVLLPVELDQSRPNYKTKLDELGGLFEISPDGMYLLTQAGPVLQIGLPTQTEDLVPVANLDPHLVSLCISEQNTVIVSTSSSTGTLQFYSYPGFEPGKTFILEKPIYRMAFDENEKLLFAAVGRQSEDTSKKIQGEVVVFDLARLL